MTEPLRPPDDELVSAHLDGEASAEDAARVEADPASRARRDEFAAIRAAVARPVEVPASVREASLAAALDVFDLEIAGPGHPIAAATGTPPGPALRPVDPLPIDPPVVPLVTAPVDLAARRAQTRRVQLLSAAAAVVAVLFLAGAVRLGLRASDVEQTTTGAPALSSSPQNQNAESSKNQLDSSGAATTSTNGGVTTSTSADAVISGPATTAAPPPDVSAPPTTSLSAPATTAPASAGAPSTTVPPAPGAVPPGDAPAPDLGVIESEADLREAVDATNWSARPSPTPANEAYTQAEAARAASSCDAVLRATDAEVGALLQRAFAVYQGTPALVLVYAIDRDLNPAANGDTRVYAVDRTTCAVLANQTR